MQKHKKNIVISLSHNVLCFLAKKETLAFLRKKTSNPEPKLPLNRKFQDLWADKDKKKLAVILSYLRNQRAIRPLITHCQHKNSLHPSRRMAWEILRHGVARNFPSPRKKTRHSSPNLPVPIIFYKISKNKSVFILFSQNKALSLQCCSGQQNNNH